MDFGLCTLLLVCVAKKVFQIRNRKKVIKAKVLDSHKAIIIIVFLLTTKRQLSTTSKRVSNRKKQQQQHSNDDNNNNNNNNNNSNKGIFNRNIQTDLLPRS